MSITEYIRSTANKYGWRKYYMLRRPVDPGTAPKSGMMDFINYDTRMEIKTAHGVVRAWSEVYYNRDLSESELNDYEMARA